MLGLMQDWPLAVRKIIEHAESVHSGREVTGADAEGVIERTNWGRIAARARKLSAALAARGISHGDRLATLAFNGIRHVECWYAIASAGAVYHTINPRLFPEQIV